MNLENTVFRWTGAEWAGYYVGNDDDVGILSVRASTKGQAVDELFDEWAAAADPRDN
jgi:hypothetical protein